MQWITGILVGTWIILGITWDYLETVSNLQEKKNLAIHTAVLYREKVAHVESMLEICLKHGTWNLQGYYFKCEAVYLGVSDYHVNFKD